MRKFLGNLLDFILAPRRGAITNQHAPRGLVLFRVLNIQNIGENKMNKIIAAIVGLALIATPVLATGPFEFGTIDTYFSNTGLISAFDEQLTINNGKEGVLESIISEGPSELTVLKNTDLYWHPALGGYVSANEDKLITWQKPDCHVEIDKTVWWGDYFNIAPGSNFGTADIYRDAVWNGAEDITHAGGMGQGIFIDNINSYKDVSVYQSVGLDQPATCLPPSMPHIPNPPTCTWCTHIDP